MITTTRRKVERDLANVLKAIAFWDIHVINEINCRLKIIRQEWLKITHLIQMFVSLLLIQEIEDIQGRNKYINL